MMISIDSCEGVGGARVHCNGPRSVMRAGINTWHIGAGVCPAVGQQSRGN